LDKVKSLKKEKELEELVKKEKSLVVDFSMSWCGPCKALQPLLGRYGEEHPGVTVVKVDCDKFDQLSDKHEIQSVPTILGFVKGERVVRFTGYRDYEGLCRELKALTK
jgi:thioredoxin 1